MKISRDRHRAERHQFSPRRNTRPKNASDIDISDSVSILRGTWSPIHCLENALERHRRCLAVEIGSPSMKRKSYCCVHGRRYLRIRQACSNGTAFGNSACWCDHDGRRSANTAVASVATSPPPCVISTHQCWLERLALTRRTSRSNGPSRDRRAEIHGQRQRIARALRMIDQRPQDGRGRGAAERADKGPVIRRWSAPASGCRRR